MAETDPVTGQPKDIVDKVLAPDRYDRLMGQKGKADQLSEAIASEKGQMVLHEIQKQFLARVDTLINGDGECMAYKKILINMGLTLNIGEVAVKNLMRMVTKK